ncbi:MAG TPA: tripartite tricarboxylate transporter TctB family protein [Candidatus Binatia bacterium]|jgi:putative tricarboxylic transport membrane protein
MKKELAVCTFWLFFSLFFAVESYRLGLSVARRPGPGFFPFIATLGIGVIAALRLTANLRSGAPDAEESMPDESGLVGCVISGIIAYALLLDILGFLLCTFLLIAFYLKLVAARRWAVSLSFAAIVAVSAHVFFDILLKAELPRGLLSWFT